MDFVLQYFDDAGNPNPNGLNFKGLHWIETGTEMIKKAVLRANGDHGSAHFIGYFDEAAGKGINNTGKRWIGVSGAEDFWWIPAGTRQVRIEGRRQSSGTLVSFGIGPIL
jgi:hypothetical protein